MHSYLYIYRSTLYCFETQINAYLYGFTHSIYCAYILVDSYCGTYHQEYCMQVLERIWTDLSFVYLPAGHSPSWVEFVCPFPAFCGMHAFTASTSGPSVLLTIFTYMGGRWNIHGLPVFLHEPPLHVSVVPELLRKTQVKHKPPSQENTSDCYLHTVASTRA